MDIPVPEENDTEDAIRQQPDELEAEEESDKSTDSELRTCTYEDREESASELRHVIPARRGRGRGRVFPEQRIDRQEIKRFTRGPQTTPRPQRTSRPPVWMQSNDWQAGHRPFIFTVRPEDVSYLWDYFEEKIYQSENGKYRFIQTSYIPNSTSSSSSFYLHHDLVLTNVIPCCSISCSFDVYKCFVRTTFHKAGNSVIGRVILYLFCIL